MKRRAGAVALLALTGCPQQPSPKQPEVLLPTDAMPAEALEAQEQERTAAIEHAMNVLAPVASQCWAAAAIDDYQLAGELALLTEVHAERNVVGIHRDTVQDPVLLDCLRDVILEYQWPEVMVGAAFVLPFAFTAPLGQNVIDRAFVPPVDDGARVLLDSRNSGNAAASMFELVVPEDAAATTTASERSEVWIRLDTLDATVQPPRSARTPAPGTYLVVAVPGGDEDAVRRARVLPASPADPKDKKRPKAVAAPIQGAFTTPRPGVGTVTILVEPSRTKTEQLSASILDVEAGAAIPAHVHDGSTELLYVLSGSGTMVVDGVTLPVTPTTVVQIPAGVEHSFTAAEALQAIQLYTPAGPEQRFRK